MIREISSVRLSRRVPMKNLFFTLGCHIVVFFIFVGYGMGVCAALVPVPGRTFTSKNRVIGPIVCDDRNIWGVIGAEGLIRIDKVTDETSVHSFSTRELPDNSGMTLAFDNDSALLAGTSKSGIFRFNDSKWEQLPGLSDSLVWRITVDGQGRIWVWTGNSGILCYDNEAWQPIINQFSGMLVNDSGGDVWIMSISPDGDGGCTDAWIREYIDGEPQAPVSLASICPDLFYQKSLVVDNNKNCWIGALNKLIKVTGESIATYIADTGTDRRTYCSVLAANSDDVLLIATKTYVSGLFNATKIFLYDQKSENPFDSTVLTTNNYIDAVGCADEREGCFWLSASDGTIVRIDTSGLVTPFATGNAVLPANSIAALLIDNADNVWAATANGIGRCSDTAWTVYPAPGDTFPGNDACCLAMDSSGVIWAGFQQPLISAAVTAGLSCFGGDSWRMLLRTHYSQKAISIDKNGNQWVVTEDGVYRYHEMEAEKVYKTPGTSSFDTLVNAIAIDGDNIPWIGTDGGLKKFENGIWFDDTAFNRLFPESEGAGSSAGTEVTALCFHDSTAWIGTSGGLCKRTGNSFMLFDTTGGLLPDPHVQCIFVDRSNSVWVGTRRGLVHINGEHHTTYTSENTPLCDNDITACAVARNGDVWIGTHRGGLTVLRGAALTSVNGIPPKKYRNVESVDIAYRAMSHGASRISIRTNSPATIGFYVVSLPGKLVRRFDAAQPEVQFVEFIWDGSDRFNRPVSAGIYLGVATANGRVIGSKIMRR